jgi:hypothetical protein
MRVRQRVEHLEQLVACSLARHVPPSRVSQY